MNKDEISGKARNLKGRAKEAAGALSGNPRLQQEGQADRAGGAVQEGLGKARRQVGEAVQKVGKAIKR